MLQRVVYKGFFLKEVLSFHLLKFLDKNIFTFKIVFRTRLCQCLKVSHTNLIHVSKKIECTFQRNVSFIFRIFYYYLFTKKAFDTSLSVILTHNDYDNVPLLKIPNLKRFFCFIWKILNIKQTICVHENVKTLKL